MPSRLTFATGYADRDRAPAMPGAADPVLPDFDSESISRRPAPSVLSAQLSYIDRQLAANLADALHRNELPRMVRRSALPAMSGHAGRD